MIEKTEALVLRIHPYSRSSHVVIWLTPEHGRVVTLVKGACRPKSAFLGQYDLFYTCELLFYLRETNGLHIARECSPLHTRSRLRSDWRASACASYMADILARWSVSGTHHHELYSLATRALDGLAAASPPPAFVFWFEMQLAAALGFAPRISHCEVCRRRDFPLAPDSPHHEVPTWFFLPDKGNVICPTCSAPPGSPRMPPDVLALLRRWQTSASQKTALNTRCSRKQLLAIQKLLGMFLEFHIDSTPQSRQVALDLLTSAPSELL